MLDKFYFIYENLLKIQSLYEAGVKVNDQEIYLKLDSTANCANELDERCRAKLNTDNNLCDLLNFSGLSMAIIRIRHNIELPEDYHPYWNNKISPFYEDQAAKKNLENLFIRVEQFVKNDLSTVVKNLKSLLDCNTFINLEKFNIEIDQQDIETLKNAIRYRINNEYDILTYKTLELYYYSPTEIVNASSHRLHWHMKLKSNFSDMSTKNIPYGDYLIENLTINKLVELAADFNIQVPKISLLSK